MGIIISLLIVVGIIILYIITKSFIFVMYSKKFRIIQIDDVYIPQVYIFGSWEGIDKHYTITWNSEYNQIKYCGYSNNIDAKERIRQIKEIIN